MKYPLKFVYLFVGLEYIKYIKVSKNALKLWDCGEIQSKKFFDIWNLNDTCQLSKVIPNPVNENKQHFGNNFKAKYKNSVLKKM